MISETPAGTRVSVVTYDTTAKVNLVPTRISLRNRPGIHGKIPGRVGKSGPACLACGLKLAAKLVENGGKIVLVTAGNNEIKTKLAMNIPLYTVTYSSIEDSSLVANSREMYVLEDSEDGVDEGGTCELAEADFAAPHPLADCELDEAGEGEEYDAVEQTFGSVRKQADR